jgi:hypothetical protein
MDNKIKVNDSKFGLMSNGEQEKPTLDSSSKRDSGEETSLFNVLYKQTDLKPNMSNYFSYKFFDNNGEHLKANTFIDYSKDKVELFKDNPPDKKKYDEWANEHITAQLSEDEKSEEEEKNLWGPQRKILPLDKAASRDRNFKPY